MDVVTVEIIELPLLKINEILIIQEIIDALIRFVEDPVHLPISDVQISMGTTNSSTAQSKLLDGFLFEPEMVFLRDCLSACLFPKETKLVSPSNLNWDRFYGLLIQNKLAGLFYKLGKSSLKLWPDELQQQLRMERYRLMIYGDWCEKQIRIVFSELSKANIVPIVLKGWSVVQILYEGEFDQRPSSDIDLLVVPQDIPRVDSILTNLGFRKDSVELWPGYTKRYLNSCHYSSSQIEINSGQLFNLDIHWGIPDIPYYDHRRVMEPFFERSIPINISDIEARSLGKEDHLIYVCSHIAHHGYNLYFYEYFEIATILLRWGPVLDWKEVISRASALRVLIPLQKVLFTIAKLWPMVIPLDILETLANQKISWFEQLLDKLVSQSRDREKIIGVLAWFTTPGLLRKIGYSLETLIPGPTYLRTYFSPAPLGWWPLLHLKRLVVVISNRFK